MSKRIFQIVVIAALTTAASLPAVAGDMNNALGGALGGVAGAAAYCATQGSTGYAAERAAMGIVHIAGHCR